MFVEGYRSLSSSLCSLLHPLFTTSLSTRRSSSSGCGWRNGLQTWRVAANIFNKQSRSANKGCSSSLGVGWGAKTHQRKTLSRYETFTVMGILTYNMHYFIIISIASAVSCFISSVRLCAEYNVSLKKSSTKLNILFRSTMWQWMNVWLNDSDYIDW